MRGSSCALDRRSAPVPRMPAAHVLVELLAQMQALEHELDRGGDRGGIAGAELPHRGVERARLADLSRVLLRRHVVADLDGEAALERADHLVELAPAEVAVEHAEHGT